MKKLKRAMPFAVTWSFILGLFFLVLAVCSLMTDHWPEGLAQLAGSIVFGLMALVALLRRRTEDIVDHTTGTCSTDAEKPK